jgi:threonine/homoserine/homoserine lactone efflux protein
MQNFYNNFNGKMEPLTSLPIFLSSVILISLSGVMAPGPVFAVTVAKGYESRNAGIFIALGHGLVEIPLILLLFLGLSEFFRSVSIQKIVSLLGGLALIALSFQMVRGRKKTSLKPRPSEYGSLLSGFIATAANPYFFLWWATVGASLILKASAFGHAGIMLFTIVHWSCDLAWDTLVAFTIFSSRRFWTEKVLDIISIFCATILAVFGVWFLISVLL